MARFDDLPAEICCIIFAHLSSEAVMNLPARMLEKGLTPKDMVHYFFMYELYPTAENFERLERLSGVGAVAEMLETLFIAVERPRRLSETELLKEMWAQHMLYLTGVCNEFLDRTAGLNDALHKCDFDGSRFGSWQKLDTPAFYLNSDYGFNCEGGYYHKDFNYKGSVYDNLVPRNLSINSLHENLHIRSSFLCKWCRGRTMTQISKLYLQTALRHENMVASKFDHLMLSSSLKRLTKLKTITITVTGARWLHEHNLGTTGMIPLVDDVALRSRNIKHTIELVLKSLETSELELESFEILCHSIQAWTTAFSDPVWTLDNNVLNSLTVLAKVKKIALTNIHFSSIGPSSGIEVRKLATLDAQFRTFAERAGSLPYKMDYNDCVIPIISALRDVKELVLGFYDSTSGLTTEQWRRRYKPFYVPLGSLRLGPPFQNLVKLNIYGAITQTASIKKFFGQCKTIESLELSRLILIDKDATWPAFLRSCKGIFPLLHHLILDDLRTGSGPSYEPINQGSGLIPWLNGDSETCQIA